MRTIKISLNAESIEAAIKYLEQYKENLKESADQIVSSLAQLGYSVAASIIANHVFNGDTLSSLSVERVDDGRYILSAASQALLFLEFGAGLVGGGNPLASEFGFGPGTYPGKGHWDDPHGWFYPTDDSRLIVKYGKDGQGLGHSYGTVPAMPFYLADEKIKQDTLRVAREVFASW